MNSMKAKNILRYLVVILISLQFWGCSNTDAEQKFEQTPTERLNAQKQELSDLLLTSPEGWKLVYFTDNTQLGGYTHLFKFSKDGSVEMASDFDADTKSFFSEYQVQTGSAVSLVFTTKNRIHLLSDSNSYPTTALRGKGYLGDFQFLYYGQENGEIVFKTNREVQEIRFVKATKEDWDNLPQHTIMEQNVIGNDTRPLFRLLETNDGTTKHQFDFSFSPVTRFAEANSLETGYAMSYDMGVAFTPTGIIVSPAVEVGSQKLSVFTYNAADGSFTATGTGNASATIKYTAKPLIITDDYKNLLDGKPQVGLAYIAANLYTAATTSSYCKALLDKANATLPANQKISRITVYFNTAFGNYIEYRFGGGKPTVYHNFTTSEDATDKTLILNHDSWDNGSAYIPAPAFLKEIDDEYFNPKGLYVKKESFKITYINTIWTITSSTTNFRITNYQL